MQCGNSIAEILIYQQVLQEVFDDIRAECEVLVRWMRQNIVIQASESYYQVSYESSNQEQSVPSAIRVPNIVDFDLWSVVFNQLLG